MANYIIKRIEVKTDILDDSRYDAMFSVEEVNRLATEGMPFRDAYKQVGMAVQRGEYTPNREVNHTHIGSIGNLCNDKIAEKMNKVLQKFGF